MTEPKKTSVSDSHEYATNPDLSTVVKGLRIIGEHAVAKEFDSPCLHDWLLEVPQHALLLLRGEDVPQPVGDTREAKSIEALGEDCKALADEIQAEATIARGTADAALSPSVIAMLIKAVMMGRMVLDALPESVRNYIRKFLPFL